MATGQAHGRHTSQPQRLPTSSISGNLPAPDGGGPLGRFPFMNAVSSARVVGWGAEAVLVQRFFHTRVVQHLTILVPAVQQRRRVLPGPQRRTSSAPQSREARLCHRGDARQVRRAVRPVVARGSACPLPHAAWPWGAGKVRGHALAQQVLQRGRAAPCRGCGSCRCPRAG